MSSIKGLQGFTQAVLLACLALVGAPALASRDDRETHDETRGETGGREDRESRGSGHGGELREDSRERSGSSGDSGRSPDDLRSGRHGGNDDHGGHEEDGGKGQGDQAGTREGHAPRIEFERDSRGHERLRSELLVITRPRDLAKISDAGFSIIEQKPLAAGEEILARVRTRGGSSIERALQELAALVPDATVAPHHLFRAASASSASSAAEELAAVASTGFSGGNAAAPELGIIDTGIAPASPRLARALMQTLGFAPGGYVPRTHGTVVGDVAARAGALLCSADVFGVDAKDELAAPTSAIVSAIDWLSARGVRVLNISITGPDNPVLQYEIRRAIGLGVMIVAAAGNDGPAAPPAFPAAYPGVIAVTAVDSKGRVYRRANRGDYISFAARGVGVVSPLPPPAPAAFSGTSFAAPLVAVLLLQRRTTHPQESGADALLALRGASRDLGTPGRDATYGWGELAVPDADETAGR